jgi:hypothetical protein
MAVPQIIPSVNRVLLAKPAGLNIFEVVDQHREGEAGPVLPKQVPVFGPAVEVDQRSASTPMHVSRMRCSQAVSTRSMRAGRR